MKKVILSLAIFFLLTVAVFIVRPFGNNNTLLEQTFYLIAACYAASNACLALKTYGQGPRFPSLLSLALGISGLFIADAIFFYYDFILHNLPYPSIADYIYLFAFIFLFLGTILEAHQSNIAWSKINKKVYLVSGAFTLFMLALFSYLTVFHSYNPQVSLAENIVTIGYTVGDLLFIIGTFFLIIMAWEYRGGKVMYVWITLFVGLLIATSADLMYAMFTDQFETHIGFIYSLSQWLYILGYLFIGTAFLYLKTILQGFQKKALMDIAKG